MGSQKPEVYACGQSGGCAVLDLIIEDGVKRPLKDDTMSNFVLVATRRSSVARISVQIVPSGAWIVYDEGDTRGGRFRDRDTALRYIRREFGSDAELNVR